MFKKEKKSSKRKKQIQRFGDIDYKYITIVQPKSKGKK